MHALGGTAVFVFVKAKRFWLPDGRVCLALPFPALLASLPAAATAAKTPAATAATTATAATATAATTATATTTATAATATEAERRFPNPSPRAPASHERPIRSVR